MHCYFFILGQNKNLSIAELFSRPEIKRLKLKQKDVFLLENVLFMETNLEINALKILNFLGGTIKIGRIEKKLKDFTAIKSSDIIELIKNREKKITFGFSLINIQSKRFIKNLALQIKKDFRSKKINSRWIEAKEAELSSVVVRKNKLLEKGAEIYLFKKYKFVFLGKTLAVQDFESYSKRDYGRPGRDITSGMIPPKLAQIMLNLAKIQEQEVFLDPFCGSGTFLQEAILMEKKNILGSDISKKAIDNSQQNIKWLVENYQLKDYQLKLWQKDIRQITEVIKFESIDKIVTEPYLGPTSKYDKIDKIKKELEDFYLDTFREFRKILKRKGKIIIVIPALSQGNKLIYLNILDKIKNMGFKIVDFISADFQGLVYPEKRGSLLYSRATINKRIVREIFSFKKR